MYEPITVVKVRKETTIKIPAGGWMLLCPPDAPLHQHVSKRQELVKEMVNEEIAEIKIGRLQDVSPAFRFTTEKDQKDAEKRQKENDAAIAKANKEQAELQKKRDADRISKEEADRKVKVELLNKQHDAIRNKQ